MGPQKKWQDKWIVGSTRLEAASEKGNQENRRLMLEWKLSFEALTK